MKSGTTQGEMPAIVGGDRALERGECGITSLRMKKRTWGDRGKDKRGQY